MKRTAILTFSALVNAARTGSLSPRPYRAPRPAVRGPPILPVGGLFHFADIDSWHFSDVTAGLRNVCCWGKSGSRDCVTRLPSLTPNGHQIRKGSRTTLHQPRERVRAADGSTGSSRITASASERTVLNELHSWDRGCGS